MITTRCSGFRLVLLLSLLVITTQARPADVVDIAAGQPVEFTEKSDYLVASPVPKTVEALVSDYLDRDEAWQPEEKKSAFGFMRYGLSWQRITLHNVSDQSLDLFLICSESTIPRMDAAIVKDHAIVTSWHTGTDFPYVERPRDHRQFLLPFTLAPGETATIVAGLTGVVNNDFLWVDGQRQFWSWDNKQVFADTAYLGSISILTILMFLLCLVTRDTTSIFFFLYVLSSTVHNTARAGFFDQFLYPGIGGITSPLTMISLNLLFLFGLLFVGSFLDYSPARSRAMWLANWALVLFNAFSILTISLLSPEIHTSLLVSSVLLSTAFYSVVWLKSVYDGIRGHHRSRIFSVAGFLMILPLLGNTAYYLLNSFSAPDVWLRSRLGEVLFTIALYTALLYDLRREQMQKQAALVRAEARTNLFATMNHELRTPLNGVIGTAELLNETQQTPIQKQYSEIIISSGKLLLALINDILDLTKISQGKLELEHKAFDLDRTLSECVSTFLPQILHKEVPIYIDLQPTMPFQYLGDQYRIRQMVFNLLSNAMKFTETGQVVLSVRALPLDQPHRMRLVIAVADTGLGIPREAFDKIFDHFSQADASTTRRFGGSGLGLAICKAIVEQMGGHVLVSSEPGKGSIFSLEFPIDVDTDAEQRRRALLAPLGGKRILLLSDNPTVFRYLTGHLEQWGVHASMPTDLRQSSDLVDRQRFDAIVAHFTRNAAEHLAPLRESGLPLMMLHHHTLDSTHVQWDGRLVTLPVPTSFLKTGLAILSLFSDDATETEATGETRQVRLVTGMKILVVEDNVTNQLITLGMLNNIGINADVAENGQRAVEMCRDSFYPIILMDCEMPVMDGYEATRQILRQSRSRHPIIIALTAQSAESSNDRCTAAGMSAILHKPITLEKLRHCLADASETVESPH